MWIVIAFFSTLVLSFQDILAKKNTVHFSEYTIVSSLLVVSAILYLPYLFVSGIPHTITTGYFVAIIGRVLFDSVAMILYVRALKLAPISESLPMLSLSPVFILLSTIVINRIYPSLLGVAGTGIVLIGVYLLNFDMDTKHLLSPFHHIFKEKGILLMLLVAILWSITDSFIRLGSDSSTTYFYTASCQIIWAICFLPIAFFNAKTEFRTVFQIKNIKRLVPLGVLDSVQLLTQNIAFKLTNPAYVMSIRNTEIVCIALLGWLFFKEKFKNVLIPILIILFGITLITISS